MNRRRVQENSLIIIRLCSGWMKPWRWRIPIASFTIRSLSFEFTYELAWRLMKSYIEYQGGQMSVLPGCWKAYAKGLIKEGKVWLQMQQDRNISSHTYNEDESKQIYERVKEYRQYFLPLLRNREGIGMQED